MPDWPASPASVQPQIQLSPFGPSSLTWDYALQTNLAFATTGTTWPTANRAIFVPVWIEVPVLAQSMYVFVQTISGHMDMGIYDQKGNRIVSGGSTAIGAGTGPKKIDITDTYLNPGTYFLAVAMDNTTVAVAQSAMNTEPQRVLGVQQMASAFALPAVATLANPTSAYVPQFCLFCTPVE